MEKLTQPNLSIPETIEDSVIWHDEKVPAVQADIQATGERPLTPIKFLGETEVSDESIFAPANAGKLVAICPTGHEDWYQDLVKGGYVAKPESPEGVQEHLDGLPGVAEFAESHQLPSLKEIVETKMITLTDLLEVSEDILGRFLGLCTAEREDKTVAHLREEDRVYSGEFNGIPVKMTTRPMTRYICIEVGKGGRANIMLEPEWRYTGDYDTQKEKMAKVLSEMFYEMWFFQHITLENLSPILAKREHQAMKELLPPFVGYRFKGNKGVYFMVNGKEHHYKDLSFHSHREKLIMYAEFYNAVVECMVQLQHPILEPVDFNRKPAWLPQA